MCVCVCVLVEVWVEGCFLLTDGSGFGLGGFNEGGFFVAVCVCVCACVCV